MDNIVNNALSVGRGFVSFAHSAGVTISNARNIDVAAAGMSIYSKVKALFNSSNPFSRHENLDETDDNNEKIRKKANALLGLPILRNVKYLPYVLSPMALGLGNTIIDIASLVGSLLMLQAETDEFERQIITYPNKDIPFYINTARRVAFIFGYGTSIFSVGLDLLNKWSWTAQFVVYTGSLGTICSVASIALFLIGTIFYLIENFDDHKRNYFIPFKNKCLVPCAIAIRGAWQDVFE